MAQVRERALLYRKASHRAVACQICQRRCRIPDGGRGFCRTRLNQGGRLFSEIYGQVSSRRKAPIEIKPVYHYLPGSHAYSLGSLGCNFLCPGCQNWELSFARIEPLSTETVHLDPEEAVRLGEACGCEGLSWTYNEPTLWLEYTLDCARLAKSKGLYTNYVTNGFMTLEALDAIGPFLDVFRVDIKGFSADSYQRIARIGEWRGILDVVTRAYHHWKIHVEVVTNLIPGVNDSLEELRDLAAWIRSELSPDVPWHITRFHPRWRLSHLAPTDVDRMEQAREAALATGLRYVYLGNVWGHPANHTYCPGCGRRLITRNENEPVQNLLSGNSCPSCAFFVAGRFR
jgi:pyruvate formate lyase activating enzyme